MANRLSVIFHAVDNISSRLSAIASIGENVTTGFQRVEDAANRALSAAQSGASNASNALGQAANAADRLADATNGCSRNLDRAAQNSEDVANAGDLTRNSLSDMERAANRAGDELGDLSDQADRAGDHTEDFGERSESAISGLGSALAAAGIAKSLQEIGAAMLDCAMKGEAFETAIAQLQTISGGDSIGKLQADIVALSNKTGQASEGLADTAYNAISAGTAVENSVNMAATASELAVAGFTDTSSALSVLTTAINSYGDAAGTAEHIADSLVTVQNLGVTTVAQLAQQMGKAISTASAYNVSLENLESGYISVTKAGINAAEGTTYLASMFNELGNTGSAISKLVQDETGKTFGQLMNDGQSVADVLGMVYDKCNQNAEAMMNLWGSAEAGKAANAIISQGLETFNDNLETLQTGTGVTADAYAVMADTTAYAHNKMNNAAKNLQTTIGGQLNPALEKLYDLGADVFSGIGGFVEEHPIAVKAVAEFAAIVGTATAAMTAYAAVTNVVKALDVASLFMGPTGAILAAVSAVAALTAGITALSVSIDEEVPSVRELTEAAIGMDEAMTEAGISYQNAYAEMGAAASAAEVYIGRLEELEAAEGGHATESQAYHNILELLTRTVPELTEYIDLETNSIKGGTEALREHTEAWGLDIQAQAKQEYINSLYDGYSAVTKEMAENEINLTRARIDERTASENMQKAMERMNEIEKELQETEEKGYASKEEAAAACARLAEEYYDLSGKVAEYEDEIYVAQKEQENLRKAIEEDNKAVKEAEAAIEETEAALEEMTAAEREVSEAAAEFAGQNATVSEAADSIGASMEALAADYANAYAAAESSIEGQYDLWDKVGDIAKTSMDDLGASLDSQTQYWENYANNLETLSAKAEQIDGLSEVLKEMDDGSEESAAALAAMANASDEQLEKMVGKYEDLQSAQDKTKREVLELEIDFGSRMDEMAQKLQETVEGMNMDEEAGGAARATINSYINSIRQGRDPAVAAANEVANAVAAALNSASSTAAGAAGAAYNAPARPGRPGYASGTMDSEKVYIAGEEGPELIVSSGGDKVFPTGETDRIIAAVSGKLDNPQMTDGMPEAFSMKGMGDNGVSSGASEKTLTIKLEGSGSVTVGKGASTESLWDSIKGNLKQAVMSMLQEEMYEEGAGAYEF